MADQESKFDLSDFQHRGCRVFKSGRIPGKWGGCWEDGQPLLNEEERPWLAGSAEEVVEAINRAKDAEEGLTKVTDAVLAGKVYMNRRQYDEVLAFMRGNTGFLSNQALTLQPPMSELQAFTLRFGQMYCRDKSIAPLLPDPKPTSPTLAKGTDAASAYKAVVRDEQFNIGDRVIKHTGDFQLSGEVRAVFTTAAGKPRFVVEHSPLAPGLLHIYSPANLKAEIPIITPVSLGSKPVYPMITPSYSAPPPSTELPRQHCQAFLGGEPICAHVLTKSPQGLAGVCKLSPGHGTLHADGNVAWSDDQGEPFFEVVKAQEQETLVVTASSTYRARRIEESANAVVVANDDALCRMFSKARGWVWVNAGIKSWWEKGSKRADTPQDAALAELKADLELPKT